MKFSYFAPSRWRSLPSLFVAGVIIAVFILPAIAADYLGPETLVASKDGRNLYVTCKDARKLAVVEVAGGKVVRKIALPAEPTGIALSPDGKKLYVTCAAPRSTICVLEAGSGEIIGSLPAGHTATGPAVTPDGNRLYLCNRFDANVTAFDLSTGKEVARVPVKREPYAAAATPDGKSIFVVDLLPLDRVDGSDVAATVTVIDAVTQEPTAIRLPNGSSSVRGLCVSPDGKYAYIVHILARYQVPTTQLDRGWMNTNAMSIVDVNAKKLLDTVLLDDVDLGAANPWGVATTADGKWICVTHAGTHELSLIDAAGLLEKLGKLGNPPASAAAVSAANDLAFLGDLRQRIKLAGNGPRGVAVIGKTAYIAEYFSDTVGVVDLESKASQPARRIALGAKPVLTVQRRGEMLFHDATICFQHWQSCASCHPDGRTDGLNWDLINDGLGNPKNTRSLLLVHQSGPVMSLGVRESAKVAVRAGISHVLFAARPEEEAAAIDEYLISLQPVPSPRLIEGRLSPSAERGKKIFFDSEVGCGRCHPEPIYTDRRSHDVASSGRFDKPTDRFNTSRLIEVWRTAPYLHDGRYLTMKELIAEGRHGATGGDLGKLTEKDFDDLVEFVLSL